MKIITGAFVILILLINSCTTKDNLCEAVSCETPSAYLRIQYIDKETNKDLLFSEHAPFQTTDLRINSSSYGGSLPFKIDSIDRDHQYISIISQGNETFTLKLGNKDPDIISIQSKLIKSDCCGSLEITKLTLNQNEFCKSCSPLQTIVIKK